MNKLFWFVVIVGPLTALAAAFCLGHAIWP